MYDFEVEPEVEEKLLVCGELGVHTATFLRNREEPPIFKTLLDGVAIRFCQQLHNKM